jgi:hypothetical protein
MQAYGQKLVDLYKSLQENPRTFCFTQQQLGQFNKAFRQHLITGLASHGKVMDSTVKRMGLIAYRLAMIFTAFRAFDQENNESKLVCSDVDFSSAMALAGVYLEHAKAVLGIMPDDSIGNSEKKRHFHLSLPNEFKREEILSLARSQGIAIRTMDRWLEWFLEAKKLVLTSRGYYKKV